jgi:predicted phosphodiesterase
MTRFAPLLDLSHKDRAVGLFITDLHYPANDRDFIRRCFQGKYDFVLLGGDITEGVTLHSPGASVTGPSEKLGVSQFEEDLKLLPIKARKEMVLGNHDNRSTRSTGQDITILEKVCEYHGIGFSGNHTILPIRVGESVFKIFLTHGGGSGGTEQAVLNTLKRARDNVDATCDLYLCGHYHKYVWMAEDFRGSTVKGGRAHPYKRIQILGACGSPITWEESYAEGGPKGKPFRSCSVRALEIELIPVPPSNHRKQKQIQHRIIFD